MSIADDLQKMLNEQVQDQNDGLRQAMELHKELLSRGFVKPKKYDLPMIDILGVPPSHAKAQNSTEKRSGTLRDTLPVSVGLY